MTARPHPSRFFRIAAAALLAVLLAPPAVRAQSGPIVLEGTPNDTSGTIYYALDLGLFRKAGLDVSLTSLNNPGSAAAAIAGGSIAIGGLPLSVAAVARDRGLPLVMVAPAGIYTSAAPTAAIVVLKASALRTAADLDGKTIATRDLSNMSYLAAKLWIDANGGNAQSVHWVEINDPQDVAALQAGRIDAASISERFLIGAYFTSEAYAAAHPDVVRAFAEAIAAAGAWANKNRSASGAILEKYAQAPVPPGSTRVTYAERLSAADVQPVLDVLLKAGLLKAPLHAKDFFTAPVPSQ